MESYIQIGAGAGDQDARADFRDGFTEFVKRRPPNQIAKIILVEPNPFNIEALKRCWKDYPQAQILQMGVCPRSLVTTEKKQTFYYAEEDAPHFQVFSLKKEHVQKHYPDGTIRSVEVPVVPINQFIDRIIGVEHISMFALDIEGIDAEILLDIDWRNINVEYVSFEDIHLGRKRIAVLRHLGRSGYMFVGSGLDTNGFDLMYQKLKMAS
jgi:FkbM family methyltransferase